MFNFLLGVFCSFIFGLIFYKVSLIKHRTNLNNARLVQKDLEQLCQQCLEISDNMVKDLEQKINEGKELLLKLEEVDTFNQENKAKARQNTPKTRQSASRTKSSKTMANNFEIKLTPRQEAILNMAQSGKTIKEISQNLGVGQDQVTMVLQLYNK